MDTLNNNPKVCVVIPTFRRPDKLDLSIKSVLQQTYDNVEVIVVDDNNPDSEGRLLTEKKMKEFENEPRVKYIKHPFNKNGSAARNTGARNCDGKYVAFLDDDDEFLPRKIETQVATLEQRGDDWGACYNPFYLERNGDLGPISKETREGNLYEEVLTRSLMIAAGSNLLVRKDAFEKAGGFDESFLRNQDVEFLVKLLKNYKLAFVDYPGLIVHVHGNHKNVNFDAQIRLYMETFKDELNKLPKDSRDRFILRINKERFWFHLRDRHDIKACFSMIKKHEISISEVFKLIYKHIVSVLSRKLNKNKS